MKKKKLNRGASSRAASGGVLAGLSALAGVTAVVVGTQPVSATPSVGYCGANAAKCAVPDASATAASAAIVAGPQLAALPTAPPSVGTISSIADRPISSLLQAPGGYRLTGSSGGVYSFGSPDYGNMLGHKFNGAIVGAASSTSGGYWLAGSDGGVFPVNAPFYGSAGAVTLHGSIAGIAADPATGGYWLVGSDGGVFPFNAPFYGSAGNVKLNGSIVGIAPDLATGGYWLVGSDGGVFPFNAPYLGGLGGAHLGGSVVGIASTPDGGGYWLVGSDGGVFNFGDAGFYGSLGGHKLGGHVVSIASTPDGQGYWVAASDGGVFNFGDAKFLGSAVAPPPPPPPPPPAPPKATPVLAEDTPKAAAPGLTGLDLSQYQCGDIPAARFPIAVVQVSGGGLNNPPNPCFTSEAAWAGSNLQAYIYMNGVPNPAPAESMNGKGGKCTPTAAPCIGYNFGWNWVQHWVAYAKAAGAHPKQWWLDVENGSGWTDQGTNDYVLRGALDALRSDHLSAGIYSSAAQWNGITGGMVVPGVPLWVPGAGNITGPGYTATQFCGDPTQRFAGGHVKYVQFGYTGGFAGAYSGPASAYDMDYAC